MTGLDAQVAVAIGLPVIGGLIWLIRLEGRVNLHERLINDAIEDVRYIRERIDAALNGRHK